LKILDQYCKTLPGAQNVLDIFAGEWSSALPDLQDKLVAGSVDLFNDQRILWAAELWGGFAGQCLLELGPLEAGHTYMLEKLGAASITAIEANTRAFLKCLMVKELYGLSRCRFLLGDFVAFLRETEQQYNCCIASGVLYHMTNPVELLGLIAKVSNRALIWTHYYDEGLLKKLGRLKYFGKREENSFAGFTHSLYKHSYGSSLRFAGFCGGSATFSYWLTAEDILSALRHVGFRSVEMNFHQTDHPNGPAFCLACEK
jgi:hypothetical protein